MLVRSYNNAIEMMRIDSNGTIGIGTSMPDMSIKSYNEWQEILELAKTNLAIKSALEKLMTTYYLSKDNGSKT